MTQTPEQRRRNAKFAREQVAKWGKSEESLQKRQKVVQKSPISPIWLGLLAFALIGPLLFELLNKMFGST